LRPIIRHDLRERRTASARIILVISLIMLVNDDK
jgi:hypothetical protein